MPRKKTTEAQIKAGLKAINANRKDRIVLKRVVEETFGETPDDWRLRQMAEFRKAHEGQLPSESAPKKRAKKTKPTIVHVNQLVIRSNAKHGTNEPPLTVRNGRRGKDVMRAHEVIIHGPSRVIHSPHEPLPCGARVWIETESHVELVECPNENTTASS